MRESLLQGYLSVIPSRVVLDLHRGHLLGAGSLLMGLVVVLLIVLAL